MPSAQTITCHVGESCCPVIDEVVELRQWVITDPLTGLFNLRHFQSSLDQELERTRRTGMATAVIMIDLDHFKSINDEYGHENGNRVLCQVAELLNEQTRRLDVSCRYGGEEFVVILPSTELMLARQVAERFRAALEESTLTLSEGTLKVTASLGVAVSVAPNVIEADELIELADQCLYEAKREGRNQVRYVRPKDSDSRVNQDEKDALKGLFGDD